MHPKQFIYFDTDFENWIRKQPCIICGRKSECSHLWHMGGKKVRNSYVSLPMCRDDHTFGPKSYHRLEHKRFEEYHNVDLDWEVINHLSKYLSELKNKV